MILFAETGTDWCAWVDACRAAGLVVVALIQGPAEPTGAFVERARAYVASRARGGGGSATTVVVGANEWSEAAIRARSRTMKDRVA